MPRSPISLAALALALAGLAPLTAATEKDALAAFKADLAKVAAEARVKEATPTQPSDPTASVVLMRQMCQRLRQVRTDGLPPDLKSAYADAVAALSQFEQVFAGYPETPAELPAFMQRKVNDDPGYPQKLQADVTAAATALQPKIRKLDEIGRKYGIENLGNLGKGVGR